MHKILRVVVEGRPVSWSRPWKPGGHATDPRSDEHLEVLTDHLYAAQKNAILWPLDQPLEVFTEYWFGPKRTGRTVIVVKPANRYDDWMAVRPDLDNLDKLVREALEHSKVTGDDKLVVRATSEKRRC